MATLSAQQVYAAARQAGATHAEAITLTAIARGESGWIHDAHNSEPPDNSYGLWQINMLGTMGANRRAQFGISSNEALFDPRINAKAAVAILRSQGWKAWSVYTNGSYKSYMPEAQAAGSAVGSNWQSVAKSLNQDWGEVGDYIGGTEPAGGGGAGAAVPQGLPPNASPAEIEAYVREHFPQAAGFLDIPELRTILIQAAQNEWTPEKLQGALQGTTWWRNNADATRSYYALKASDPAQLKALIDQKVAEIAPQMAELGLDTMVGGAKGIRYVAEGALKYGWTPDQIRANFANMLRAESRKEGVKQGSATDLTADKLMAMARAEYFVPINRQDAERWAIDIYAGRKTEESLRDYFGRLAASRFPGLAEQGFTPGDYMAPVRNVIAETLEISPAEVDLLDPRWSAVLEQEGKDGRMRPMSIAEASKWARKQPAFLETKGALDKASQLVGYLGQKMGVS